MQKILTILILICINSTCFADALNSLTLTDAEMKKLKKYFPVEENERLMWKGDPITIELPIGQEKRLVFPTHVSVDVKGMLNSDQLRLLNDDKSLYLTALKPFSTTRIFITLKDSGEVLLIDLVTNEHASKITQYIDVKKNNLVEPSYTSSASDNNFYIEDINYADLIRYAWQQAYSPDRLINKSIKYTRSPMHTQKIVYGLVYGDKVLAFPQAAWLVGNHYVTAVLLRNKYPHESRIDIRGELCGEWQAATIYPYSILKPYGNKDSDTTMLFLVSSRPFGEIIGVCHGNA